MSSHHGQHRSRHSRSRMHHSSSSSSHYQSTSSHSRSRNSSSNVISNIGSGRSGGHHQQQSHQQSSKSVSGYWSEHQSSSGKVYYYNTKTGVSQWELPAELRHQQQLKQEQQHYNQHHHHHLQQQQQLQQQHRHPSPESEISESSSIKHQQDKSPSSSAVSSHSAHSDLVPNDKPLLTPSLAQYFKPELIVNFNSSHIEDLERQANQYSRDALLLSERILKESVDLKIAKAVVHYVEISLEAQEKKYAVLRDTINNFGFV